MSKQHVLLDEVGLWGKDMRLDMEIDLIQCDCRHETVPMQKVLNFYRNKEEHMTYFVQFVQRSFGAFRACQGESLADDFCVVDLGCSWISRKRIWPSHSVATASGLDAMVVIRYLDVGFKFCLVGSLLSIVPRQRINRCRWLEETIPWCRRTPGSSAYVCVCRQQRESGQVHQI